MPRKAKPKSKPVRPAVAIKDGNLIVRLPVAELQQFAKVCEKAVTTMSAEVRAFIKRKLDK